MFVPCFFHIFVCTSFSTDLLSFASAVEEDLNSYRRKKDLHWVRILLVRNSQGLFILILLSVKKVLARIHFLTLLISG